MSQFTSFGYDKVREYVKNFNSVGIGNETTEIKRFNNVPNTVSGNTITYVMTVDNVDGAFTNKNVNIAKIYENAQGTQAVAEATFTSFTYQSTDDTLTLTISVEVPTM